MSDNRLSLLLKLTAIAAVGMVAATPACLWTSGNLPVTGARMPVDGLLVAGQPTQAELEAAVRAGYGTVINLRSASETGFEWEREAVERLGARYVWIPVAGSDGLTRENVEQLDAGLRRGLEEGSVLLHCASGNRVGAMLALREAWLGGKDPQEALRFGVSSGMTRLEPATREILGLPASDSAPVPARAP